MEDCIFCKIIKGEIPSYKLYEDELTYSFLDISPISDGHALVIPKYHGATLMDIPEKYQGAILKTSGKVARAIMDSLEPKGLNYMINQGTIAAQVVMHVHLHILPRYDGSELKIQVAKADNSEKKINKIKDRIISNL